LARTPDGGEAADADPLASKGVPFVLAVEIAVPWPTALAGQPSYVRGHSGFGARILATRSGGPRSIIDESDASTVSAVLCPAGPRAFGSPALAFARVHADRGRNGRYQSGVTRPRSETGTSRNADRLSSAKSARLNFPRATVSSSRQLRLHASARKFCGLQRGGFASIACGSAARRTFVAGRT